MVERVLMHTEHHIPPEQVSIEELRALMTELKGKKKDPMSEVPLSR